MSDSAVSPYDVPEPDPQIMELMMNLTLESHDLTDGFVTTEVLEESIAYMIPLPSVDQPSSTDSDSESDTSSEDLPPLIALDSESDDSSDSNDDESSNDDSPRLFGGLYSATTPLLGQILILEQDMTEMSE
eukprot:1114732-Rhodomonas_salina.1